MLFPLKTLLDQLVPLMEELLLKETLLLELHMLEDIQLDTMFTILPVMEPFLTL